jgi:outer membrane protein assembly factor BamB
MSQYVTKILTLSITTFVLGLLACSGNSKQGATIQWRGTDRSGVYHETGLKTAWATDGPELIWHFDGLGEGFSSIAIDAGRIFATGMIDETGFAFSLDLNGNLLNKTEYGKEWNNNYNGARGTITPSNGKLYLVSGLGQLYCFDQSTLQLIWSKNLLEEFNAQNAAWGMNESPLIIGEKVIVTPGGEEHNILALNKNDGELIWSSSGKGDISAYCSAIFIDDREIPLIVTMTGNHILGLHAETGEMLWSHPFPSNTGHTIHPNSPIYDNNMLFFASGYGGGAMMLRLINDGKDIEEVWSLKAFDIRTGGAVKVGDYIYGSGDINRFWFCVNWHTGEIMWQDRIIAMGNIIANDNMLYCYTERGEMVLARATPEKFDIVSQFSITLGTEQHWAHPVIYRGVLYVRHGNTLIAYNIIEN